MRSPDSGSFLNPLLPEILLEKITRTTPKDVIRSAKAVSQQLLDGTIAPNRLSNLVFDKFEKSHILTEQAALLLFLTCLEKSPNLWPGTHELTEQLRSNHEYTREFSRPFQHFISRRLKLMSPSDFSTGYENVDEAQKIIALLLENTAFFLDVLEIQEYFSQQISPIMPLNATWNPILTARFGLKNTAGIQYVYAHQLGNEYVATMKQYLSSEWTGFNRFINEPWPAMSQHLNPNGKLVDIGASIGISALEIAQQLEITGDIVLVDYYNPFRDTSSLRIVDYEHPQRKLIPLSEAREAMEHLRNERTIVPLFGIDIGQPLEPEHFEVVKDASLVHLGNVLPYIPSSKLYQTLLNCMTIVNESNGILKIHNDANLPVDSLYTSMALQRLGNHWRIIPEFVK